MCLIVQEIRIFQLNWNGPVPKAYCLFCFHLWFASVPNLILSLFSLTIYLVIIWFCCAFFPVRVCFTVFPTLTWVCLLSFWYFLYFGILSYFHYFCFIFSFYSLLFLSPSFPSPLLSSTYNDFSNICTRNIFLYPWLARMYIHIYWYGN